ncbi:RidA family protein [Dactylosporangium maewongense]|uniref:RidA family protein n=1 Tax=Dactylosporangium maewongense TaxID=634393 RepID=A0ABN2B2M6_9ACTN|nr:RidA family protein [Dactylosporangium sp. NBC_01737]
MQKEPIVPAGGAPPAGPYSPGIRAGNLLFVSGQGPFDADGKLIGDTFQIQARATFANIERIITAAGGNLSGILRIGAYLHTLDDFAEFNDIMRDVLPTPHPARTTIPVPLPGFLIEIDAVVLLPDPA